MKFKKENIQITIDKSKGELTSISIDGNEILYQRNQTWKKTFPILFPAVGIVKKWIVNNKKTDLQKHGYWNQLKWDVHYEEDNMVISTICNNKILPYTFDIELWINIQKSKVTLSTYITNAGYNEAYFHFGWHPAFKVLPESIITLNKDEKFVVVNNNGLIEHKHKENVTNKRIMDLPFGNNIDSLIALNTNINMVTLSNKKYDLNLYFDAPNLVLWKKPIDNFICVEPYHGYSDSFSTPFIHEIEYKRDIIKLNSLETYKSMYVIEYKKASKSKTKN